MSMIILNSDAKPIKISEQLSDTQLYRQEITLHVIKITEKNDYSHG